MAAQKGLRRAAQSLTGKGWQLKMAKAAGAAADTNITVTGIKKGDQVVAILHFEDLAVATGDVLKAELSSDLKVGYPQTDVIQLETTVTTGDTLLVIWLTKK